MKRPGYTLIEILVSVAVFSFISVIALGTFSSVMKTLREGDLVQQSMNDMRITMELMAREFRTGTNYHLVGQGTEDFCPASGDPEHDSYNYCLAVYNQAGHLASYYRGNDDLLYRIEKDDDTEEIRKSVLTSNRVRVKNLGAVISPHGDQSQENITIILEVAYVLAIIDGEIDTHDPFLMQTTVTSRNYDR